MGEGEDICWEWQREAGSGGDRTKRRRTPRRELSCGTVGGDHLTGPDLTLLPYSHDRHRYRPR